MPISDGLTAGAATPRPAVPEKPWCVVNPHGIRWRARFRTSRAAWMRAMAPTREVGESPNAARARLLAAGWRVEPAAK